MDGEMSEENRRLERLIAENKGLVLFSTAVASARHRMGRLPPEVRTAVFVTEAIGQYLDLAGPTAPSDLVPSTAALDEAIAALRLLRLNLAASQASQEGSNETVQ
jgi:hypothetical protein